MKLNIFLLIFLFPQVLFAQKFEITIKIQDPENNMINDLNCDLTTYYRGLGMGKRHIYSAVISDKTAIIKDTISASEVAMLTFTNGKGFTSHKIVIDSGAIYQLTYNVPSKKLDIISNSKSDSLMRFWFKGLDSLTKIKNYRLNQHKEFIAEKKIRAADSILKIINDFENDLRDYRKKIARTNPDNIVSPYLLTNNKNHPDLEELKIYENFTDKIKKSSYGVALKKKIDNILTESIPEKGFEILNQDLIPIIGNTLSNKQIILNEDYFKQNKQKLTLIEFWASWCAPCKESIKKLYSFYYLNKAKGFNIILVSLDDDGEKWKKASIDDNYPWLNISDGKGRSSEIPKNYKINAIPANILVNAKGKIIARNIFDLEKIKQILDK